MVTAIVVGGPVVHRGDALVRLGVELELRHLLGRAPERLATATGTPELDRGRAPRLPESDLASAVSGHRLVVLLPMPADEVAGITSGATDSGHTVVRLDPAVATPAAAAGLVARHLTAARLSAGALSARLAGWVPEGPFRLVDAAPLRGGMGASRHDAASDGPSTVVLGERVIDADVDGYVLPWWAGIEEMLGVLGDVVAASGPLSSAFLPLAPVIRAARDGLPPPSHAPTQRLARTLGAAVKKGRVAGGNSRSPAAGLGAPVGVTAGEALARLIVERRRLELRIAELEGEAARVQPLATRAADLASELSGVRSTRAVRAAVGARGVARRIRGALR